MTDAERLEQVAQDNQRLIDRNRELDAELARCKQRLGEYERAADDRPEDMTTCSAYDLLSDEDRETLQWVRDQGGLEVLRKLADVCDLVKNNNDKLRLRVDLYKDVLNGVCKRLGLTDDAYIPADGIIYETIDRRLMPEGMEWPRYESGEPVRIGGEFMGKDGKTYTAKQIQFIGKCFSLYDFCDRKPQFNGFYGERVKHKQFIAADGEKIEIGQSLYGIESGIEYIVDGFVTDGSHGKHTIKSYMAYGQEVVYIDPQMATHRKQVRAADGEPLEVGQTVWHVDTGEELFVSTFVDGLVNVSNKKGGGLQLLPSQLTHQRPVLDADGVPIRVDDEVYGTVEGGPFIVTEVSDKGSVFVDAFPDTGMHGSMFTHTKPEQDSWEQLKEDIYREVGHGVSRNTLRDFVDSIVRRCKALAERDAS